MSSRTRSTTCGRYGPRCGRPKASGGALQQPASLKRCDCSHVPTRIKLHLLKEAYAAPKPGHPAWPGGLAIGSIL